MFINPKTFYGIDNREIEHIRKNMFPIWEKDPDINKMLLSMAMYLMNGGMNGLKNKYEDLNKSEEERKRIEFCADLPKYVMTKTTLEIIKKIKITPKAISNIQELKEMQETGNPADIFAHISLDRQFFRYMIVANNIFVVHCYLYKNADKDDNEDYVGYSVFQIGLGGTPEDYERTNTISPYNELFFQILIFLKYTEPDIKVIPAGKKVGTKKSGFYNLTNSDVQVVDSNWNTTVMRTEGFSVDGHLRLQACGEGMKKRKLIWIEPFEKHGYIRKAKRLS